MMYTKNVRDQTDTIERLKTDLTYGINDKNQPCNLPIYK